MTRADLPRSCPLLPTLYPACLPGTAVQLSDTASMQYAAQLQKTSTNHNASINPYRHNQCDTHGRCSLIAVIEQVSIDKHTRTFPVPNMASQDKADTKERKENSRAPVTPLTAKSWFTWYRVAASAVVLLAGFASPQFSSSFYGKAVVGIAKCVAFSQTKAMGQCLSNVFSGRAAAPDTPVTGTAPGETAGDKMGHPQGQKNMSKI